MNNLPESLKNAVDTLLSGTSLKELQQARQNLSERYRERGHSQFINHHNHRFAYLLSRMPATFAVIDKVFQVFTESGAESIESLLDLGTGPGTLVWSAASHLESLNQVILVEKDGEMVKLGKTLLQYHSTLERKVLWNNQDFTSLDSFSASDLVTASYALSELKDSALTDLLPKLWQATKKYLMIIEPGTPYGFQVIEKIRKFWLEQGGGILAPCTHLKACPLIGKGWCHFSERINRSKEERFVKQGQLSYEDEKYSYLILSKSALPPKQGGRIIHTPKKASGHVHFNLCTEDGIQDRIISKKQGDIYKQARKLEWGDWLSSF